MSKIDEQIKKLREQEKRLEQEKLKVEFLTHILGSVQGYNEAGFSSVKAEVVELLEPFITKSIEAIETGNTLEIVLKSSKVGESPAIPVVVNPAESISKKKTEEPVGANEKLSFALANRHLGGKMVSVINDKNISIKGKVVGLDSPYVLVQTDTGPTIKVPLEKVSIG